MKHLRVWLKEKHGRSSELARQLGLPLSFVHRMATGQKPIPLEHGAAIEQATGGAVTRQQMFPDRWAYVWPELVDPQKNQPVALDGQAHGAIAAEAA